MSDKPRKAYQAHDGDEQWTILFATNGAEARRWAANEFDCTFEEIEWCRRVPALDEYSSKNEIPVQEMLDIGWWLECQGCSTRIDSEEHYDRDDNLLPPQQPVGTYSHAYCSQGCKDWHLERELWKESVAEAALQEMTKAVFAKCPDAIIKRMHVYVDDDFRVNFVTVVFDFPGSVYGGATAAFDLFSRRDISRGLLKRRVRPLGEPRPVCWRVVNGDIPAWNAYRADSLWAYPQTPYMEEFVA